MSWLYRALGVPRTLDEFFDKASKKGEGVVITVGCYPTVTSYNITYFIKLESGNTSFVMDDFSVGKLDPLVSEKTKILESNLLKQAKSIQGQVKDMGLESRLLSINGDVIPNGYMTQDYCHIQPGYSPVAATA